MNKEKTIKLDNLSWEQRWIIEGIMKQFAELDAANKKNEEQIKSEFEVRPFIPFNLSSKELLHFYPRENRTGRWIYGKAPSDSICIEKEEDLLDLKKQDEDILRQNQEIAKINLATLNKLKEILIKVGVPEKITNPKSRKLFGDKIENPVFIGLRAAIRTSPPTLPYYDSIIEKSNKYYKDLKLQKERVEREFAKREKEKRGKALLLNLVKKYDVDVSSGEIDKNEILEKIIYSNQYLCLAHYMSKNRSDWSDGPAYAKRGMDNFIVENVLDHEIHDSVWPYIEEWEGDGRVFRDCEWSYDRLFSLVSEKDPELFKDYKELIDAVDFDE